MVQENILSQKLISLKYYSKCTKILKMVVTVYFIHFVGLGLTKLTFKMRFNVIFLLKGGGIIGKKNDN
jgi:hypothetical protein